MAEPVLGKCATIQYQPNSLPNNLQLWNCPRTWLRHSRGFWGEIDMFLEGFRMEIGLLDIWQCPQNYWGWIFYSDIILHSERLAGNYMLFFSLDQRNVTFSGDEVNNIWTFEEKIFVKLCVCKIIRNALKYFLLSTWFSEQSSGPYIWLRKINVP